MKTALLLAAIVAMVTAMDEGIEEEEWEAWKSKYGKVYPSADEEEARRQSWLENIDFVEAHYSNPESTYFIEMNQFADELSVSMVTDDDEEYQREQSPVNPLAPKEFDWRKKGVVSPVKNQGQIGAVEAYVAAECVESFHAIHTGKLYDLSSAEVFACCSAEVGLPIVDDVFECIHNIGGLCKNSTYKVSVDCENKTCEAVAQVTGTKHVPHNDEGALQTALLTEPIWVTVNASPQTFLMYQSGVYSDPNCVGRFLDHVLQLVGYGVDEKGMEYWICKNSWGQSWGMSGYILIQKGVNRCGIAEEAKYPY